MKVDADRAAGALLGLAAGDALGAGYEFTTPAAGAVIGMVGGGGFGWEPGEWTDDTQMALCIAQVTAGGTVDLDAIGEAFLAWFRGRPKDVGNQTRAVLGAASSAADLTAVAVAHFARNPKGGAGNGSLMRTAPVALACLGDDAALRARATEVSALTHGDPLAGEACVLWCVAIDRAVREGRLDGVRDGLGLLDPGRRAFWAAALDGAEAEAPEHFRRGNGFVVTALQAAWSAIWHTRGDQDATHLARALEAAVRIGGDTDTVAAIAGQVLGARYGASAIPWHWRRVLHGWPGLRAGDLVRLAVLTARRGGVSAGDWPLAQSLLAAEHHGERALCNAVADDADLLVGNLPGLALALDQSVDAVVSLCRVGTADIPSGVEHVAEWLVDQGGPEHNPNLDFVLADALDAVRTLRAEGKRVYLHCVGGRSRTATVAAAYLAQHLGVSGPDALARLAPALPEAAPNPRFLAHVQAIAAPPTPQLPAERRLEAEHQPDDSWESDEPPFDVPFWLKEVVHWRIAAELVRRHPASLWVYWEAPLGGFYDCLGIYRSDRPFDGGSILMNRLGTSVSVGWLGSRGAGPEEPPPLLRVQHALHRPRQFVLEVERRAGLRPVRPLPASTGASLAVRMIAACLSLKVLSHPRWTARSGAQFDWTGHVPVEPRIGALPGAHAWWRAQPDPAAAAQQLWFLGPERDAFEPLIALTQAGEAHGRDGRSHDLVAAYRDVGRSLTRMVAAIAGDQLG